MHAGLPDPGATREQLQSASDRDAAAMLDLLAEWEKLDMGGGLTTAEVIAKLKDTKDTSDWLNDLRAAVEDLCGRLDGRALGNKLRHFKRRNFQGKMIDAPTGGKHANRWRVYPAGASAARPPTAETPPIRGEGGERGEFPAERTTATPPPTHPPGGERGEVPAAEPPAPDGKRRYRSNPYWGTPLNREGGGP